MSKDISVDILSDTQFTSSCPVCLKLRVYKTDKNMKLMLTKPCRSCANSIARGGVGKLYIGERKYCIECKTYYLLNNFYSTALGKVTARCKECTVKIGGKYHREVHRFKKYGLTKEQFVQLLKEQEYKCKLCSTLISVTSTHIDHCHTTNIVRGLLCELCNKGLGQFKENIQTLTNAINYLNQWNQTNNK